MRTDTPTRARQSLAKRFNSGSLLLSVKAEAHCDLIMTEFLLYRRWSRLNGRRAQLEFDYYYFFFFFPFSKLENMKLEELWNKNTFAWKKSLKVIEKKLKKSYCSLWYIFVLYYLCALICWFFFICLFYLMSILSKRPDQPFSFTV